MLTIIMPEPDAKLVGIDIALAGVLAPLVVADDCAAGAATGIWISWPAVNHFNDYQDKVVNW